MNYHVSLFDLQLGGSWEYKGVVKIDTKITRATNEIVLNSKEIDVRNAEILGKDGWPPLSFVLEMAVRTELANRDVDYFRRSARKDLPNLIRQKIRTSRCEVLEGNRAI